MKKLSFSFFIILFPLLGMAQNFGLEHDTIFSSKSVDFFTFYLPNDFYNDSGQDLQLRWVKEAVIENYEVGGHGGQNNTGLWDYSIQDPQNFYTDGAAVDSADFVLQSEVNTLDKFIVQVYPNDVIGNVFFSFSIYEIGNPDNIIQVHFDYTATASTSSSSFPISDLGINVFPNPVSDALQFEMNQEQIIDISIYNHLGHSLIEQRLSTKNDVIDCSGLTNGMYFIQTIQDKKVYIQSFIKQ